MEINYPKLGLTLYLVLTLSQLTIDGIESYIAVKAAEAALAAQEAENKKQAAALKLEIEQALFLSDLNAKKRNKQQQATLRKERAARQQLDSARRINDQVCKFWRDEYNKSRTKYNQQMLQGACKRAATD